MWGGGSRESGGGSEEGWMVKVVEGAEGSEGEEREESIC